MVRAPLCEKMGLKKGPWSPEEDQILVSFIRKNGHANWPELPKQAGLLRCGKSCRLRWMNYLRPDIKRGNFSKEEEETIISLHETLGNRWSAIAARLPGRTDNEIKNLWHQLRKRFKNQKSSDSKIRLFDTKVAEDTNSHYVKENVGTIRRQRSSEMSSVTDSWTGEKKKMVFIEDEEIDYSSEYFPRIYKSSWSDESPIEEVECPCPSPLNPIQSVEIGSTFDDSINFWYNLLSRDGDIQDLPEFVILDNGRFNLTCQVL